METPFETHTYLNQLRDGRSLSDHRLVIFCRDLGISYIILSPSNQIVYSKESYNQDGLAGEIFLRLLFEKDSLLQEKFAECRILSSSPVFTLVPFEAMSEDRLLHVARILMDEMIYEEEMISHPLDQLQAWTLFPNQVSVNHILQEYVPHHTLSHICDPLIQLCLSEESATALFLLVFDKCAMLAVLKNGQLHLCNAYTFRADLDIVYFMQTVKQVTGLEGESHPIWVLGDVEERMQLFKNHLPQVRFPDKLNSYLPSGSKLPYWKFAYLAL